MTDTTVLKTSLAEVINYSVTSVKDGVDFLKAQVPDVIHQLLMWKLVESLAIFVLLLIGMILAVIILKKSVPIIAQYSQANNAYFRYSGEKEKEARDIKLALEHKLYPAGFGIALAITLILSFFTAGLSKLFVILQIWIAPKIYLIEYATTLAQKNL